ncbi:MAG: tRNA pseudouridine(38-40) synthase TruA [Halieaceae bacterium]
MAEAPPRFSPDPLPPGSRVACRIEYDGSLYNGWQAQPHLNVTTVQQTLEAALAIVANQPLRVHCAGRTDTGVHGLGQIIHFDDPVGRSCKNWVIGTNTNLPASVRVQWAQAVPADFHARFSALSRRYQYVIANTPVRSALLSRQVSWQRRPLDAERMHEAAQALLGEQDFSAFQAASCQSPTAMRNVQQVSVRRRGELVIIEIEANAFLHHMVRNIAGSLMAVGYGRHSPEWIARLLQGRDRTAAADTASPDGLYLVAVSYPDSYDLPAAPTGPMMLAM